MSSRGRAHSTTEQFRAVALIQDVRTGEQKTVDAGPYTTFGPANAMLTRRLSQYIEPGRVYDRQARTSTKTPPTHDLIDRWVEKAEINWVRQP